MSDQKHEIDLTELVHIDRWRTMSDTDLTKPFLSSHSKEIAIQRLKLIDAWIGSINTQNVSGVRLTPILVDALANSSDLELTLSNFDRLRRETQEGRFDSNNPIQKDLEFHRFTAIDARVNPFETSDNDQYTRFHQLKSLPTTKSAEMFKLNPEQLREVERASYEAFCLLRFLRRLRERTDRDIVVVGNHRYGRQWLVEPLEHHLEEGFTLRYDRVPSHHSWTLTVPYELERQIISGFPPEYVKELNRTMPHVVLVDATSPSRTEGVTKYTRALRDYVNWFIVFNDIRSGANDEHENRSTFPPHHFPELRNWYEYVIVRRKLAEWVDQGPAYTVMHWAPELQEKVRVGDFLVPSRPVNLNTEEALVVLANPTIYRTNGEDLPGFLRNTEPYYFNDPEKHVSEMIVLGLGPHGLSSKVEGTTTDEFVAVVQRHIRSQVDELLDRWLKNPNDPAFSIGIGPAI